MAKKILEKYPSPSVTVDIVVFVVRDGALEVLVTDRSNDPVSKGPALPGGFIREDETSVEAARRVLREKAGVSELYLEQLYTFDEPKRDPRGWIISVTYMAVTHSSRVVMTTGSEKVDFVSTKRLPKLAFDHSEIVKYAMKRLKSKLEYTNAAYGLLPQTFKLSELQTVYEAVLDRPLEKRNFLKKFLSLDLIEETGEVVHGERARPARLYRFKKQKLVELTRNF